MIAVATYYVMGSYELKLTLHLASMGPKHVPWPLTVISFGVNGLSGVFILMLGIVGFATSVYSVSYLRRLEEGYGLRLFAATYPAFLAAYIAGMVAYLRLFYVTCIKPPKRVRVSGEGFGIGAYAVLTLLAAACVVLGLLAPPLFSETAIPAGKALMNAQAYVKVFMHYAAQLTTAQLP